MSFNISGELMKFASRVTIHIDTTKFGPRQTTSFRNAVRTGMLMNASAPVLIARQIRLNAGQPFVHFSRYGRMFWGNIPANCDLFYNALIACITAAKISGSSREEWYIENLDATANTLRERKPNGAFHGYDDMTKMIVSNIKFTPYDITLPSEVSLEVNEGLTCMWSNPCGT